MPGPESVVCFGEALWDVLPSGKKAGGTPMNVAFHLHNFGIHARMVSRVGDDELRRELKQFLEKKGGSSIDLEREKLKSPSGYIRAVG